MEHSAGWLLAKEDCFRRVLNNGRFGFSLFSIELVPMSRVTGQMLNQEGGLLLAECDAIIAAASPPS